MLELVCVVSYLSIPILILLGTIKNKITDIYNPRKWNNNDNGQIKVKNIKTQNIFLKNKNIFRFFDIFTVFFDIRICNKKGYKESSF